jgi:hypothetical protein
MCCVCVDELQCFLVSDLDANDDTLALSVHCPPTDAWELVVRTQLQARLQAQAQAQQEAEAASATASTASAAKCMPTLSNYLLAADVFRYAEASVSVRRYLETTLKVCVCGRVVV